MRALHHDRTEAQPIEGIIDLVETLSSRLLISEIVSVGLTVRTFQRHAGRCRRKLGVETRAAAARSLARPALKGSPARRCARRAGAPEAYFAYFTEHP